MSAKLIYLTDEEFNMLSEYLNMARPNYDRLNLNNKLIFIREKFKKSEMPTKLIMTRAEAVDLLRNNVFGLTDILQAHLRIRFGLMVK